MTRMVLARVSLAALLVFVASCAQASAPSPTAKATATPMPLAQSADEFAAAFCSSLSAMARAVGNPDTAADSKLSAALDDAIKSGDTAAVERAAASMQAELATGRQFAAVAVGWEPGAKAAQLADRLIVAFVAFVDAKRAAAARGLTVADEQAQAALIRAGGGTAWESLLGGDAKLPSDAAEKLSGCRWWEAGAPGT